MTSVSLVSTTKRTRWQTIKLLLTRVFWLVIFGLSLEALRIGIPMAYTRLTTVCLAETCPIDQLTPAAARHLADMGFSLRFYALFNITLVIIFAVVYLALAALIFWQRPDERMALYASVTLMLFGVFTTDLIEELSNVPGFWFWAASLMLIFAWVGFCHLLYLFPDGRFVPSWTRLLSIAWALFIFVPIVSVFLLPAEIWWYVNPANWSESVNVLLGIMLVGGGVVAQIYRYRAVSNHRQRQQTKWVLYGFIVTFAMIVFLQDVLDAVIPEWTANGTVTNLVISALSLVAYLFLAATFYIAILRYRLWDIDVLIRRTLIYSVLTTILALVYFGSVVLLEQVLRTITGQERNQLVTVLSTLAIAALFVPIRQRVQNVIDRRFYRRKYDAEHVLAAFSAALRDEVVLEELTNALVNLVQETLQPAQVTLWLKPGIGTLPIRALTQSRGPAED